MNRPQQQAALAIALCVASAAVDACRLSAQEPVQYAALEFGEWSAANNGLRARFAYDPPTLRSHKPFQVVFLELENVSGTAGGIHFTFDPSETAQLVLKAHDGGTPKASWPLKEGGRPAASFRAVVPGQGSLLVPVAWIRKTWRGEEPGTVFTFLSHSWGIPESDKTDYRIGATLAASRDVDKRFGSGWKGNIQVPSIATIPDAQGSKKVGRSESQPKLGAWSESKVGLRGRLVSAGSKLVNGAEHQQILVELCHVGSDLVPVEFGFSDSSSLNWTLKDKVGNPPNQRHFVWDSSGPLGGMRVVVPSGGLVRFLVSWDRSWPGRVRSLTEPLREELPLTVFSFVPSRWAILPEDTNSYFLSATLNQAKLPAGFVAFGNWSGQLELPAVCVWPKPAVK